MLITDNRKICLLLSIIFGIVGWYSTILYTTKKFLPIPDKKQYLGLILSIFLSCIYWMRTCYTIKL